MRIRKRETSVGYESTRTAELLEKTDLKAQTSNAREIVDATTEFVK